MVAHDFFQIGAAWERRPENPDNLAKRLLSYMRLARPAVPAGLRWYGDVGDGQPFSLEAQPESIPQYIDQKVCRGDCGERQPDRGYSCWIPLYSGIREEIGQGSLCRMDAGSQYSSCSFIFDLQYHVDGTADPRLLNYDAVKTHMMAIVWSFQPAWASAEPARLRRFLDHDVYARPHVGLAWMTWLNPGLAKLMTPPPRDTLTIVEPYSDGSLFMATSKDVFDCDNDEHLWKARAIHRQIDPLNFTEPFNGVKGRSPRVPPFPRL